MRTTHTCPKCQSKRIWRIEKVTHDNTYSGGGYLRVVYDREIGPLRDDFMGAGRRRVAAEGFFDLYTCARCGYSEWYARDIEKLAANPAAGVHLIEEKA
jgi:predicted nucleic-acid-binding Zn-ribbon protein